MKNAWAYIALIAVNLLEVKAFQPQDSRSIRSLLKQQARSRRLRLHLQQPAQEIGFWVAAFSTSHIGMSGIRSNLIQAAGKAADRIGLVGNVNWTLPDVWLGDAVSGRQILPDTETAGRQIYRLGYTIVSFVTLGNAAIAYLNTAAEAPFLYGMGASAATASVWFPVAVASSAASLASLANASPLGLMPGFQAKSTSDDVDDNYALPLERRDALKFTARGLTRITRHPLILPVVPWGIAHANLCGGRTFDWLFFGGLSLYAVAGCAAQDLRVSRREGSVGTVFSTNFERNGSGGDGDGDQLLEFFKQTSFVPFGAIFDGRQPLIGTLQEIPWLAVVPACGIGFLGETRLLDWFESLY